jgi:hypothetical protein
LCASSAKSSGPRWREDATVRARRPRGPCLGGDQEEEEDGEVAVEGRRGGRLAKEEDWAMAIRFTRQRLSVAARLPCYARTKWIPLCLDNWDSSSRELPFPLSLCYSTEKRKGRRPLLVRLRPANSGVLLASVRPRTAGGGENLRSSCLTCK